MSTRAVRTEIALQNLDPRLPHSKVDKAGRLVGYSRVASEATEIVAVVDSVKVKNALVQIEPVQPDPIVEEVKEEVEAETFASASAAETEVVEETKTDAAVAVSEADEAPKKKSGKKDKKVVSTDP